MTKLTHVEKGIVTSPNSEDSGEPANARSLASILTVLTVEWPFNIMNSHVSPFYEVGHAGATTHPPTFPTTASSNSNLARILTVLTVRWPFSIMNSHVSPFYEVGHAGATTHPPLLVLHGKDSLCYKKTAAFTSLCTKTE